MLYILFGSDEFGIDTALSNLRERMLRADPLADLNDTELDGRSITVADLQAAADALPFMGGRRLVVVRGMLVRCDPSSGDKTSRRELSDALTGYLPRLPESTRLVFVEGRLHKRNPVLTWAQRWQAESDSSEQTAFVKEYEPPKPGALPRWLSDQARQHGGELEPRAAAALADAMTRDGQVNVRLADSELRKLLTYAQARAVTAQDVELLVTPVSLDSIFAFIDALAARDGPSAITQLHQYLDSDEPPLRILALIARQFRLLAQTRAMLDAGLQGQDMYGQLDVPPFVVRKLVSQAQRFSSQYLVSALRRLRDIDTDLKTGRTEPVLALDLFVASVCSPRRN